MGTIRFTQFSTVYDRSKRVAAFITVLATAALPAALPLAAQQQLKVRQGCAYKTATEDAAFYTFEPSDEARRIVSEICNAFVVSQNFDLRAASVDNALATTEGNRRIILYSTVFLKKFSEDARTRWAAYSVLAHEIGHHLNGHDFAEANPAKRKTMELEADRFSGSALRLLDATLDDAKAGVQTFALDAEQKYHPSARARLEAIASGWTQQQESLEKMGVAPPGKPRTALLHDRDADGIADKDDACPEEYGRSLTAGCPDADEDGVPDRDDACRYRKGPTSWKGCPDTDGDGVPDHEDQCPDKAGYPADHGCPLPDRDSDGVPDRADRCPDNLGQPRYQGCPDTDADGVPDPDDKCPNEKGEPLYNGCTNTSPVGREAGLPPEGTKVGVMQANNMVLIKGGTFPMGSNDGEDDERPVHQVTVSDFYLSRYEVTVAEFRAFVEDYRYQTDAEKEGTSRAFENGKWEDKPGRNWRHDPEGNMAKDNHPVVNVSWDDAQAYCQWFSDKTGLVFRLPTEAEWEYAAGNGNKHTKNSWGNGEPSGKKGGNVADEAGARKFNWTRNAANIFMNYNDGYATTAPVGSFEPNDFGLYDMSGNVWEWCEDWYDSDYYNYSSAIDPAGPSSGINRVCRGGSWGNEPQFCRIPYRLNCTPDNRVNIVGFRVARDK